MARRTGLLALWPFLLLCSPWTLSVPYTPETFERVAKSLECPRWPEATEVIDLIGHAATAWGGSARLAGSHAEGTALENVSDYDVWIDTPDLLSRAQRNALRSELGERLQLAGFKVGGVLQKRKAMRFQRLAKSGRSMNFNVVCLKMIYDCGFDEHDFPRFTRCDSCAEARQTASQHMQSIKSQAAVRAVKACYLYKKDGKLQSLPGFVLSHLARRISETPCETSLQLFEEMCNFLRIKRKGETTRCQELRRDLEADFESQGNFYRWLKVRRRSQNPDCKPEGWSGSQYEELRDFHARATLRQAFPNLASLKDL